MCDLNRGERDDMHRLPGIPCLCGRYDLPGRHMCVEGSERAADVYNLPGGACLCICMLGWVGVALNKMTEL